MNDLEFAQAQEGHRAFALGAKVFKNALLEQDFLSDQITAMLGSYTLACFMPRMDMTRVNEAMESLARESDRLATLAAEPPE